MKKTLIVLGTVLLGLTGFAKAKVTRYAARITFEVADEQVEGKTLLLFNTIYQTYLSPARNLFYDHHVDTIRNSKTVELLLPQPLSYVLIDALLNSKRYQFNTGTNLFLIEDGDDIKITLLDGAFDVSGKGSEKFICRKLLNEIDFTMDASISDLRNASEPLSFFDPYSKYMDSLQQVQQEILQDFRGSLSKEAYQRLAADGFGRRMFECINLINGFNHAADSIQWEPFLEEFLLGFLNRMRHYLARDTTASEASDFLQTLYFIEEYHLRLKNKHKADGTFQNLPFLDLFKYIKNVYPGQSRDYLLVYLFSQLGSVRGDTEQWLEEASSIVEDPFSYGAFQKMRKQRTIGADVFSFELVDTSGNVFSNKDFIGKKVLMEFWFLGCGGCATLAKQLKPIKEQFAGDTTVVFVTVNVDYELQHWIKGINSGLYTDEYTLDLKAPFGYKDPLMLFYGYNSYPRMLVVGKDGKLSSFTPPKPHNAKTAAELINLLSTET